MPLFGFDGAAGNFDPAADIERTFWLLFVGVVAGGLAVAVAVARLLAWAAGPRKAPNCGGAR